MLTHSLQKALSGFDPRDNALAVARSAIGLAQLLTFLVNSDEVLFSAIEGNGARCGGIRLLSLWCFSGADEFGVHRFITIIVVGMVVLGLWPRWTCIPHAYVSFSLAASVAVPSGGDIVAQIATAFFVPLCLYDSRLTHWQSPRTELPARWVGVGYATSLAIRGQIAIVYIWAALSKLFSDGWRDGTAMFNVVHDPIYGAPGFIVGLLDELFTYPFVLLGATWGAVVLEMAIGLCVLGPPRTRLIAVVLASVLHGAIAVTMGLISFSLIMTAFVVAGLIGAQRKVVISPDKGVI